MSKTWFITGTSKGFGREWTEAALERGDRVAATARGSRRWTTWSRATATRVLPIPLDVTDRDADFAAVERPPTTSGGSTSSSTTPATGTSGWSRS